MSTTRRRVAVALAGFPFLIQIPFSILASRFDHPDVLRLGADKLLPAFHAGGAPLVATWYAYALCILPFMIAILALPAALGVTGTKARAILGFGLASSIVQMAGLLRWTFVVPYLAEAWQDPAKRQAVAVAFEVQHKLFGNLLGEHLGQLTLGAWTLAVILSVPAEWKKLRALGALAALLFGFGMVDGVTGPLQLQLGWVETAPLAAFIVWSVWLVALGVQLWRKEA